MKISSAAAVLFVGAIIAALKGEMVAAERHTTFYSADELTYEEPGGNLLTFAKIARA